MTLLVVACNACYGFTTREPKKEPPIEIRTFANGLKVTTQVEQREVTAIHLSVQVGSADEKEGEGGLAHLVEHLVCSAETTNKREWIDAVAALGAVHANATTELDRTNYFAIVPSDQAERAIELYLQVLGNPLARITDERFAREQQTVKNETALPVEFPLEAWTVLGRMLFLAGHRYAGLVSHKTLAFDALTPRDAQRFFERHYRPENVTLSVVGGLTPGARSRLTEFGVPSTVVPVSATGELKRSTTHGAWEPVLPDGPQLQRFALPSHETRLWFAWKLPPGPDHFGYFPQAIAGVADERLRFTPPDEERFEGIRGTHVGSYTGGGTALLVGTAVLGSNVDVEDALDWVTNQVRRSVFEAFGRTKRYLLHDVDHVGASAGLAHASWLIAAEHPLVRADLLNQAASHGLDVGQMLRELEKLGDRGADDIRAFAEPWLTKERVRAVYVVGGSDQASVPLITSDHERRSEPESVFAPNLVELNRLSRPPRTSKVDTGTLANGLDYVFFDWPGARVPTVILGHNRGPADAIRPEIGIATQLSLMRHTWLETGERRIVLRRNWAIDASFIQAQSPTLDVVSLVEAALQREQTATPLWPEYVKDTREFPSYLKASAALARAVLLRDHPWSNTLFGGELDGVSPAEVNEHYQDAFSATNGVLIAVGDHADPEAKSAILGLASGLRGTAERSVRRAVSTPLMWTPLREVRFEREQAALQRASFECLMPSGGSREANLLVETAIRRVLMDRLRYQRAVAYSVYTSLKSFRGEPVLLTAQAEIPRHGTSAALRVWRDFLSRPAAEVLSSELVPSRFELARSATEIGLTTQAVATALFHAWREGRPFASVERLPSAIALTDDPQVLETFEFCREHSVLTFYGDRDRLKSTWSEMAGEDISALNR